MCPKGQRDNAKKEVKSSVSSEANKRNKFLKTCRCDPSGDVSEVILFTVFKERFRDLIIKRGENQYGLSKSFDDKLMKIHIMGTIRIF